MNKLFTQEQEKYIADNYRTTDTDELAERLGVKRRALTSWANRHGLYKKELLLTQEQKDFITTNYMSMTYGDIGSNVGLSARQVEGWVAYHIHDKKSKIRAFNDRYFEVIDTSEKAYWLGFLFADGYVVSNEHNRNYELGMELQSRDEYILKRLNECLGGKHHIYRTHKTALIPGNKYASDSDISKLRVYSKNVVKDLISHGIEPNKTRKDTVPMVSDILFRDFLRGYIDGDGCIYRMRNGETRKQMLGVYLCCASKPVLEYINSMAIKLYGIGTRIYKVGDNQYRLFWYRSDDVRKLLDIMYYDSSILKLERKYETYKSFYRLAA